MSRDEALEAAARAWLAADPTPTETQAAAA